MGKHQKLELNRFSTAEDVVNKLNANKHSASWRRMTFVGIVLKEEKYFKSILNKTIDILDNNFKDSSMMLLNIDQMDDIKKTLTHQKCRYLVIKDIYKDRKDKSYKEEYNKLRDSLRLNTKYIRRSGMLVIVVSNDREKVYDMVYNRDLDALSIQGPLTVKNNFNSKTREVSNDQSFLQLEDMTSSIFNL